MLYNLKKKIFFYVVNYKSIIEKSLKIRLMIISACHINHFAVAYGKYIHTFYFLLISHIHTRIYLNILCFANTLC